MKAHLKSVGPAGLLVVVASSAAHAAVPGRDPVRLTLARTRAIAVERAPAALAVRARAGIAQSEVAAATPLLPFNPRLRASLGPRIKRGGSSIDVDASLTQRFEIGGQRGARIDRARADVDQAAATSEFETRRLAAEASALFVRVLHAEAALEVRTESASVARSLLASVRRRHEVGEIGGLDVNVAMVALARIRAARAGTAARRSEALGRLRGLLGIDPSAPVVVVGALEELPDYSLDALYRRLEERADLVALRSGIRSATAERSLGSAEAWPDVGVFVRYGREEDANIAAGGLLIDLPIFRHGQALRARGDARRRALELELDARRRRARAELAGGVEAYEHMRSAVRSYQEHALPQLFENLERGRKAYQAGAIPIGEFLSIQREIVAARMSYVDLLLDAQLEAFELELLAGTLP